MQGQYIILRRNSRTSCKCLKKRAFLNYKVSKCPTGISHFVYSLTRTSYLSLITDINVRLLKQSFYLRPIIASDFNKLFYYRNQKAKEQLKIKTFVYTFNFYVLKLHDEYILHKIHYYPNRICRFTNKPFLRLFLVLIIEAL